MPPHTQQQTACKMYIIKMHFCVAPDRMPVKEMASLHTVYSFFIMADQKTQQPASDINQEVMTPAPDVVNAPENVAVDRFGAHVDAKVQPPGAVVCGSTVHMVLHIPCTTRSRMHRCLWRGNDSWGGHVSKRGRSRQFPAHHRHTQPQGRAILRIALWQFFHMVLLGVVVACKSSCAHS